MPMTLRLPPDLERNLAAYCVATGTTRAATLRTALSNYLDTVFRDDTELAARVATVASGMA